jgi:hypothetical protein
LQLPTALVNGGAFHLRVLGLAKNSGYCMQSVTPITNRNSADSTIDIAVGMHDDIVVEHGGLAIFRVTIIGNSGD